MDGLVAPKPFSQIVTWKPEFPVPVEFMFPVGILFPEQRLFHRLPVRVT